MNEIFVVNLWLSGVANYVDMSDDALIIENF